MNPRWNRDAWARIQGDMNPENERFSSCSGVVLGVKPGEAVKELCGFEVFLATRFLPLEDGNIRRINKEVIFYCQSGTRSAHSVFVLAGLLGYKKVKNYDGSWIEWSHDLELEIEMDALVQ